MFIVAIDGPAGSGKGTVAKNIAEKTGFLNVDTGAMFRCVAFEMIKENVKIDEFDKIKKILDEIEINLEQQEDDTLKVFLNGNDVSNEIRTEAVSEFTSPVSLIPEVREKLLILQRDISKNKNIVMEGRDIGTVVFPNADVKIYLDASKEERAKRRCNQLKEKGEKVSFEEVLKDIEIRDKRDMEREIAPLKKAKDAIYIDSTNITADEVTEKILKIIEKRKNI